MNRRRSRQVLECAGRAQRRRRFGSSPDGYGNAYIAPAKCAESKAAWRFGSRRTPKRWRVGYNRAHFRQVLECAGPAALWIAQTGS